MKVTNSASQGLQNVAAKKSEKSDKAAVGLDKKASPADLGASAAIELSPRAKDIKKATELAKNSSPDIDEAKVAKYQKLIDSGEYKINAGKVADKLVDEHLMNAIAED